MSNENRFDEGNNEPSGEFQEGGLISLKELSESGTITLPSEGKPTVTFVFNGIDSLAPAQFGNMEEKIGIDINKMADVCRSFGISSLTINVDTSTERENYSVQIAGIDNFGGATGNATATGRRPLSTGELEEYEERRAPHGARWARGVVSLTQQRINGDVQEEDPTLRNVESRAKVINQALINGIVKVGIPHLVRLNKGDMIGLALYAGLYLQRALGLPFDPHIPNLLDFSSALDVVSNPIVLYVMCILLTYFISKGLLQYENTRFGEATPWGPETIRALRALGYKIPQINERSPLVREITST